MCIIKSCVHYVQGNVNKTVFTKQHLKCLLDELYSQLPSVARGQDRWSEEVHLWTQAVRVEVHRESRHHLWVQVCALGLQLDQESHQA